MKFSNGLIKTAIFIFVCSFFKNITIGQELNLDVQVNAPNLLTADMESMRAMQQDIKEFMNQTKWTNDDFDIEEKIEGSILINVTNDVSITNFTVDIYINAGRPVFQSNYFSPTIKYVDRGVGIVYEPSQLLTNANEQITNNLSAILSYYAYIIIGLDYDSFSPAGGEKYFEIARQITTDASALSSKGWNSLDNNKFSRFALIDNLMNSRMRPFRIAFYEYHRHGLDKMYKEVERARATILSALQSTSIVNRAQPNSALLKIFADTKKDEIREIFEIASYGEKSKIYDIFSELDPAKQADFRDFKGIR